MQVYCTCKKTDLSAVGVVRETEVTDMKWLLGIHWHQNHFIPYHHLYTCICTCITQVGQCTCTHVHTVLMSIHAYYQGCNSVDW